MGSCNGRAAARWTWCAVITCALSATSSSLAYADDLALRFDCYLSDSDLECPDVRTALSEALPGVTLSADENARLSMHLRDTETGQGRRYFAALEGVPLASTDSVAYRVSREIPHSAGHDRALALLVALLQQGIVPFLSVDEPGRIDEGALSLRVRGGENAEPAAPSPWYLRPSLGGSYFGGNLTSLSASAGLELSFSDPEWRWLISAEGGYRYLDIDLPGVSLRGDFFQVDAQTTLARMLFEGLSIGTRASVISEPQNNLDVRTRAGLGFEWVLSPFLAANETNVGARVLLDGVYDRYSTYNQAGESERAYLEPRVELLARVHTQPVDFELSGGASFIVDTPEFWGTWADLSAAFRIADGLQLTVEGGLLYRGAAVNAPAEPSLLNPVATTTGSNFGELTASAEVSLSWTIGNGLIRSQDQRWR